MQLKQRTRLKSADCGLASLQYLKLRINILTQKKWRLTYFSSMDPRGPPREEQPDMDFRILDRGIWIG